MGLISGARRVTTLHDCLKLRLQSRVESGRQALAVKGEVLAPFHIHWSLLKSSGGAF